MSHECTRCGACCVAPDIAALDKPLGVRCRHLTADNLCAIYEARPEICRAYRADELCERGIRTFETSTRNTLDINAVPVLKSLTHLPVLVDPSHAIGIRQHVPAVARAAVAAGADGLIVEVHPHPEAALSDGHQSLDVAGFAALMEQVRAIAAALGRPLGDARARAA